MPKWRFFPYNTFWLLLRLPSWISLVPCNYKVIWRLYNFYSTAPYELDNMKQKYFVWLITPPVKCDMSKDDRKCWNNRRRSSRWQQCLTQAHVISHRYDASIPIADLDPRLLMRGVTVTPHNHVTSLTCEDITSWPFKKVPDITL